MTKKFVSGASMKQIDDAFNDTVESLGPESADFSGNQATACGD